MGTPYAGHQERTFHPSTRDEALAFVAQLEGLSLESWTEVVGAYREAQGVRWRAAEEAVNSAIGRSRRMSAEGEVVVRVQGIARGVHQAIASHGQAPAGVDHGIVNAAASMAALALLTRDEISPKVVTTLLQPFARTGLPLASRVVLPTH